MTSIGTGEAVTDRGSARVPTTATVSVNAMPNSASTVTIVPAATVTSRVTTLRPGSVIVTLYVPG